MISCFDEIILNKFQSAWQYFGNKQPVAASITKERSGVGLIVLAAGSMLLKAAGLIINRHTIWLLICLALAVWLFKGYPLSQNMVTKKPSLNADYLNGMMEQLRKTDPEAAAKMSRFIEGRNLNALVAAMKIEEKRYGSSTIREMASRLKNDSSSPLPWFELTAIATNPNLVSGPGSPLEDFVSANSMAYGLLYDSGSRQLADWYQVMLREAAQNSGRDWPIVKTNPVALLVWTALGRSRPDLWNYFVGESEWLSEALLFAAPHDVSAMTKTGQMLAWVPEVVEGLKKYHPLGRNIFNEAANGAVNENGEVPGEELEDIYSVAALLTAGLLKYGDIVSRTSLRSDLPAVEVLELLIMNPDMFGPPEDRALMEPWADNQAAMLINIHKNRPNVWAAAHMKPLVLKLDSIAPHLSESLMINYGADDIQVFLFDSFEDDRDILLAAEAVDRFGDLAIAILEFYKDNPEMIQALRELGPRVIPFLAKYGNSGFEMLNSPDGLGWLNKYFDEDGKQRETGWIVAVPLIGGPVNVIQNWANGYPSTWGELGWAALDVADGALLIASLGVSASLTAGKETAKTGIKGTVRKTVAKDSRRLVGIGAQQRSVIKNNFSQALKSSKIRAGFKAPLFRALAKGKALTVTLTSVVWRTASAAVRVPAQIVWKTMVAAKRTWTAIPPTIRKYILRAVAAVGILYTVTERSLPILYQEKLPNLLNSLPKSVGKISETYVTSVSEAIAETLKAALPGVGIPPWVVFSTGLLGLTVLVYALRPRARALKRV